MPIDPEQEVWEQNRRYLGGAVTICKEQGWSDMQILEEVKAQLARLADGGDAIPPMTLPQ